MSEFASTKFLTGMRAYAALGVLLIHQGGGRLCSLGPVLTRFVDHLRFGVVVFFVLSAFTLAMSLDRSPRSYVRYIIGRLLRIAPLYYLVCLVSFFMPPNYWANFFGVASDGWNLLSHLTFLSLFDVSRINSLIGLEWTVVIEMFYYTILPLAVVLSRNWKGIGLLALVTLLFSLTIGPWTAYASTGDPHHLGLARQWCPERYAIAFLLGVLAYRAVSKSKGLAWIKGNWAFALAVVAFACPIIFDAHFSEGGWVAWYASLTAWVILTSGGVNRLSRLIFENRCALYLGKISYSIYLTHVLVLTAMNPIVRSRVISFPVVLLLVVALSSLTYYFVEQPFIESGKRLKPQIATLLRKSGVPSTIEG